MRAGSVVRTTSAVVSLSGKRVSCERINPFDRHVTCDGTKRFTQIPTSSRKYTLSASFAKLSTPLPWQHQNPALGVPNSFQ